MRALNALVHFMSWCSVETWEPAQFTHGVGNKATLPDHIGSKENDYGEPLFGSSEPLPDIDIDISGYEDFFSEDENLKCTQGSSCSTNQECGKNGSCNSKLGCKCGKKTKKSKKSKKTQKTNKPVPVKCIEDAICDVLGTEDDCPDGICFKG